MNPEILETTVGKININELNAIADENRRDMANRHKLVSRYRHEKVTNKDYNGRQLLELIQNADDAGSLSVKIILDTANNSLKVINTGNPFTLEGFRSLMIPNLSPKRKKIYIGNKGLGFRSVLNWSDSISVLSAGVKVTFSREQAKNDFDSLYTAIEQYEILSEYQYSREVVPFPVFAVPEIVECDTEPGVTIIDIIYTSEQALADIRVQLAALQSEVLLFLNHITSIELSDNGVPLTYGSTRLGNIVSIGKRRWTVYDNKDEKGEDPVLPEEYRDPETTEVESYSLKIAIQDNLSDSIFKLFSFFPTKVSLHFPAVIHGTFELDSSRNQIVESKKNAFLVERLKEMMFRVSGYIDDSPAPATWNRFRFLNYNGQKDTELNRLGFYTSIDSWLKVSLVLPCFDNTFKSYSEISFLPLQFSEAVDNLSLEKQFPELLLKIPDDIISYFSSLFPNYPTFKRYGLVELRNRINAASEAIFQKVTPVVYAGWISAIRQLYTSKGQEHLKLLYSEENILVGNEISLFTPSKNAEVEIPSHVKIEYLNSELYENLLLNLKISDALQPSRRLKDDLENFVEIQSFEPVPVLNKVISETNDSISQTTDLSRKRELVKSMLNSLYEYYQKSDKSKNSQVRIVNIPVISVAGTIIYARDSYLSEEYSGGVQRAALLGALYSDQELVAGADQLGLSNSSLTENFLVDFLGVNRFVNIDRFVERTKYESEYNNFVFTQKTKPDRFRDARISYSFIRNIEQIRRAIETEKLSRENLVAWLCLDQEIKTMLSSTSDTEFYYNVTGGNSNSWPVRIYDVPSYIKFQLSQLSKFDAYILENEGISFLNNFEFDFKAACFSENGIASTTVKDVLKMLGAKTEFNELSISRIETILRQMPDLDPSGRQARKIYMLCTDRYKEKKEPLRNKVGLKLHATLDEQKDYFPYDKVYYSRTIGLPNKITAEKPILNFPKRSAELSVVNFFNVQTFDNIEYVSDQYRINEPATKELSAYLKLLRPYILLRRLSNLKKGPEIKEAVRTIKSLNIILCDQLSYNIGGENREAEEYDFIAENKSRNNWLIKYRGVSSIDVLKRDSLVSDVISEIYTITFDVTNLADEIRFIYRDDLKDTRRRMVLEYGDEELANVLSKLEVSESERKFWVTIYALIEKKETVPLVEDERDFRKQVSSVLKIDIKPAQHIDFENLEYPENAPYLREIFHALNIAITAFNEHFPAGLSFFAFHKGRLIKFVENIKSELTQAFWQQVKLKPIDEKKLFISKLNEIDEQIPISVAEKIKYETSLRYDETVMEFLKNHYHLDLTELSVSNGEYLKIYEKNKKLLACSEDQLNSLDQTDRSLCYFEMDESEISRVKSLISAKNAPAVVQTSDNEDQDDVVREVSDMEQAGEDANRNHLNTDRGKRRGGSRGNHSHADDIRNTALGLKAERAVKKILEGKIYEWVSGYSSHPQKSDTWGYDFKFKETPDNEWNYIEVKWFGSGTFHLPDTEFLFALDNPKHYYLYLVTENMIKKVLFKNLLTEGGALNPNNNFFTFDISEYKFKKL